MRNSASKRYYLAVWAGIGFASALVLALTLIAINKFTGAEFTAFVLAFAVLAVAVGFAPEIQEVSIAGNVVKLKEVKAEAVRAIESLNKSRIETLRVLLGLSMKTEGGFMSEAPIDPRLPGFWRLVDLANEYECFTDLKEELLNCVTLLLKAQLIPISIRTSSSEVKALRSLQQEVDPLDLTVMALDRAYIEEAALPRTSVEQYETDIKTSIREYTKLYQLKKKISAAL
ncbi:hypothetical protein ACTACT_06575 [Pseudomonas syringae]|uniref:hypothetical protein n=1 Tax=Pseudomonas syringae TaxID=317 RepID=UPI003F74BC1B